MMEERLEAAGGGTITLSGLPPSIKRLLADTDRSATSWVMATPGRIPPWALSRMTRSDVAALSHEPALLTGVNVDGTTVELELAGLAHYLTDAAGKSEGFPSGPYYAITNATIAQCQGLVTDPSPPFDMQPGTAVAGAGAPSLVSLADTRGATALEFVQWTAKTFNTSWRVGLAFRHGEWRPALGFAPLSTMWGNEASAKVLITPDIPTTNPLRGTWLGSPGNDQIRVVRGGASGSSDGSGLVSSVSVFGDPDYPAAQGDAFKALKVRTVEGSNPLERKQRLDSNVVTRSVPTLNAAAKQALVNANRSIRSWEVTLSNSGDIVTLPLGLPVAIQDLSTGAYDPAVHAVIGPHGAAPLLGARIIARKSPFVPGEMGCYVALSGEGEGWRLVDISEWVEPVEGSIEVAFTTGAMSLAQALGGRDSV